jgi:hypothetical protein
LPGKGPHRDADALHATNSDDSSAHADAVAEAHGNTDTDTDTDSDSDAHAAPHADADAHTDSSDPDAESHRDAGRNVTRRDNRHQPLVDVRRRIDSWPRQVDAQYCRW